MQNPISLEALSAWLDRQPPEQEYDYGAISGCLLYQYFRLVGLPVYMVGSKGWYDNNKYHPFDPRLNDVAVRRPRTFGAAAKRAKELLG